MQPAVVLRAVGATAPALTVTVDVAVWAVHGALVWVTRHWKVPVELVVNVAPVDETPVMPVLDHVDPAFVEYSTV